MKKSDIFMVVIIAAASILVSFFVANSLFGNYLPGSSTVKTINKVSSTIEQPDPTIFNANAINPTIQVSVDATPSSQDN